MENSAFKRKEKKILIIIHIVAFDIKIFLNYI